MSGNNNAIKTYLFCYRAADINHVAIVKRWLEKRRGVIVHHSPVPLIHLLKTYMTATDIQEEVDFLFPEGDYIISEINPQNTDGKLSAADWAWLNSNGSSGKGVHPLMLQIGGAKT